MKSNIPGNRKSEVSVIRAQLPTLRYYTMPVIKIQVKNRTNWKRIRNRESEIIRRFMPAMQNRRYRLNIIEYYLLSDVIHNENQNSEVSVIRAQLPTLRYYNLQVMKMQVKN